MKLAAYGAMVCGLAMMFMAFANCIYTTPFVMWGTLYAGLGLFAAGGWVIAE